MYVALHKIIEINGIRIIPLSFLNVELLNPNYYLIRIQILKRTLYCELGIKFLLARLRLNLDCSFHTARYVT